MSVFEGLLAPPELSDGVPGKGTQKGLHYDKRT
jgi:hypothetical protein